MFTATYVTSIVAVKLDNVLKENIHFTWLSAINMPDHKIPNRFRSDRIKDVLKEIFVQIVKLLVESGYVSLQKVLIDGTKMESRAIRYTFDWGNSIKTTKSEMTIQIQQLRDYTQSVTKEELENTEDVEFRKIDSQNVKQTIIKIDTA